MIKIRNKFFIIYTISIFIFSLYIILDTFVIPKADIIENNEIDEKQNISEGIYTSNSYNDDNINITINEIRKYDTTIYIADIVIDDISYLKRAFAFNTYGRNISDTTSNIADDNNAILAINGDYYGFRNNGYVVANGKIYRNTSNNNEALVIYNDGTFNIINESTTNLSSLKNIYQVFSFGPALIKNSNINVNANTEVGQAMASNPRTAIGITKSGHYLFVVSDGRTNDSKGLSLYELATIMEELGCVTAYNLDGGGSTTMYFNGEVINNPTTNGRRISERKVSDIVYIGY